MDSVIIPISFVADGSTAGWVTNRAEISGDDAWTYGDEVADMDSIPDDDNGEYTESTTNNSTSGDGMNG